MKRMKVSKNAYIEKAETDLLQRLTFRYLPYWPIFLGLVLMSLAAGWFYLEYTPPSYRVTSSILVKDEKKGPDDSKVDEALNLFGEKKIVENEMEVIRSRSILSQVVNRLRLYAPVEEKTEFVYGKAHLPIPLYRSAYLSSPVSIELEKPEDLRIEPKRVDFRFDSNRQAVIMNDSIYPLNKWVVLPWGRMRFIKNPLSIADSSSKAFCFSLVSLPRQIGEMQNRLEIYPSSKLSTVIYISYKDDVPERGEAVVNELIGTYEQAAINDKTSAASNTLDFVERRLELAGKQLDRLESNVQRFRTDNGLVDVSQQSNQYLQNVSENDRKLSEMDVQLSVLDQIESHIQSNQHRPGLVPSTLGLSDPMLTQLLGKLYDSEIQYDKLKKTTAEDNPILLSIKNEIDKIKPSIIENVRNQRSNLQAARGKLVSAGLHYNDQLSTLPEKERQLAQISRQQNIENSIYSFLLQKKEEASLAFNASVAGSKIIDKAQASPLPVSPTPWMIFLIALLVPVPLVAGVIDARELLGNKVLFRRTIEELTVLPVIGEIGCQKSKGLLAIKEDRRTAVTEQFRSLRGSVVSRLSKGTGKTVMVTSSIAREGKSFVAINLAVAFAQAGKRTVLVEADMYKPKLAAIFHLNNEFGLSNLLEHFDFHDMMSSSVHPAGRHDNLFVVPAGNVTSNPSELIMNPNFNIMMNELVNQYDIIIIDSVPLNPVPDTFTICKFADITLFVVRHGVTPKENLLILDEDPKIQGLRNVHIVFNGIKRRGVATSGFGYSYGYGFNSKAGYGYYNADKVRTGWV